MALTKREDKSLPSRSLPCSSLLGSQALNVRLHLPLPRGVIRLVLGPQCLGGFASFPGRQGGGGEGGTRLPQEGRLTAVPLVSKLQPVSGAERPRTEGRARGRSPPLGPASGARRLPAVRPFPGMSCQVPETFSSSCTCSPSHPPHAPDLAPLPSLLCPQHPSPASVPYRWMFQASLGLLAKDPPPQPLHWGWAPPASLLNFPGTRAPASRFASSGSRSDPVATPTPTSGCDT